MFAITNGQGIIKDDNLTNFTILTEVYLTLCNDFDNKKGYLQRSKKANKLDGTTLGAHLVQRDNQNQACQVFELSIHFL